MFEVLDMMEADHVVVNDFDSCHEGGMILQIPMLEI